MTNLTPLSRQTIIRKKRIIFQHIKHLSKRALSQRVAAAMVCDRYDIEYLTRPHILQRLMTKPAFFYHPDFSPTVALRYVSDSFVDFLRFYGGLMTRQGSPYSWLCFFKSNSAYYSAVYRLQKAGVLTYRSSKTGRRVLKLTESRAPKPAFKPHKLWQSKWDGIWRVFIYDIPEEERNFRTGLGRYLHKLRMGCLQQSVWVSPHDIRPEYDDLLKTLAIEHVSYLLEARTVLGRKAQDIVLNAWDFKKIESQQRWFIENCIAMISRLESSLMRREEIEQAAREEMQSYLSVMEDDPFLPRALWPKGYLGESAYEHHTAFVTTVKDVLRQL